MTNYTEIIEQNPTGVLATQNGAGADTRVVHCLFAENGRLYFTTSSEKPMYAQLAANPNASFCAFPQNYAPVLTLNGRVTFVEDPAFKARVMEQSDMVKRNYQTPENPVFKLFYLEVEEVKVYNHGAGTTREGVTC